MHVKGLHREQNEVMGLVAKHLLGPVRYAKALGIRGSIVATPKEDTKPKKQDDELEKVKARLDAVTELVKEKQVTREPEKPGVDEFFEVYKKLWDSV